MWFILNNNVNCWLLESIFFICIIVNILVISLTRNNCCRLSFRFTKCRSNMISPALRHWPRIINSLIILINILYFPTDYICSSVSNFFLILLCKLTHFKLLNHCICFFSHMVIWNHRLWHVRCGVFQTSGYLIHSFWSAQLLQFIMIKCILTEASKVIVVVESSWSDAVSCCVVTISILQTAIPLKLWRCFIHSSHIFVLSNLFIVISICVKLTITLCFLHLLVDYWLGCHLFAICSCLRKNFVNEWVLHA